MKKILVFLFIGISIAFAQNENVIGFESIIDSVESLTDSTMVLVDSLGADSNNSIVLDSEGFNEISKMDSLKDTRIKMKEKMDNFILEDKQFVPLSFFYQENFHLKTAIEPDIAIIKNGFTLQNCSLNNSLLVQTHFPFYKSEMDNDLILMDNSNYNLIVPITVTYLGLGDEEMNQSYLSFKKGSIFNVKNLNIETTYLGDTGNWYEKNEKKKNFDLHLFYNSKYGDLHFYNTTIDQEISSKRFYFESDKLSLTNRSSENSMVFHTKLFDIGAKRTTSKIDTNQYEFEQFYLAKDFRFKNHALKTSFEKFKGDFDFYSITAFQKSQLGNFEIYNSGFYHTNHNHYISSGIDSHIDIIEFGAEFISSNMIDKYYKYIGKFGMNFDNFKCKLQAGKKYRNNESWYLAESTSYIEIPTNFTNYVLENSTEYLFDAPLEFPNITSITTAKMQFKFRYNNCINMGVIHTYCSDYRDNTNSYNANNLDAFFKIKITKYFEFYVNAINILNNENMFKQINSIPEAHIIYGMKWVFVN